MHKRSATKIHVGWYVSTEGQEQRVEPEGRDACEQVRTLGAAAATRAFIWCGCSLLLNASESTSAHSGVRMVCFKVPLKGDMELEMYKNILGR